MGTSKWEKSFKSAIGKKTWDLEVSIFSQNPVFLNFSILLLLSNNDLCTNKCPMVAKSLVKYFCNENNDSYWYINPSDKRFSSSRHGTQPFSLIPPNTPSKW